VDDVGECGLRECVVVVINEIFFLLKCFVVWKEILLQIKASVR